MVLVAVAAACAVATAFVTPWALLALVSAPLAVCAVRVVTAGATGPALIPVLRDTGLVELAYAVGLAAGLCLA